MESLCGITFVGLIVSACVTAVSGAPNVFFQRLVHIEAVIALICLAGILFGDPGVVHRTPDNVSPMPAEVEKRLRSGEALLSLRNLHGEEGSYCVRCCVWRRPRPARCHEDERCSLLGFFVRCANGDPCGDDDDEPDAAPHHCSTCNRCVLYFDHHCGVFGRCIAGRGLGGNIGYFRTIIMMGVLGPICTMLSYQGYHTVHVKDHG